MKFRFEGREVFIEKDPETGNVILSANPYSSWDAFLSLRNSTDIPAEFLWERKDAAPQERDLF